MVKHVENWEAVKARFTAWWQGKNLDRPLMKVVARRETPTEPLEPTWQPQTLEDRHLEVDRKVVNMRNYCRRHRFFAEAFPSLDLNIGAGSLAVYLGLEPEFAESTVWFPECIDDYNSWGPLKYDPENYWWQRHRQAIARAVELAQGEFLVNIPDLIENLDILAAMRGAQNLCFDLIDQPDIVKEYLDQLDDLYFKYYHPLYELVKTPDGGSSYTVFSIWGPGRIAKVQCDFSALISPAHFREFALPSLRKQCQNLDYSLYHLDGPDAVKHVEAVMEIEELNALQWTPGAGQPDGSSEQWYPIYDQAVAAGKSLWIIFSSQNSFADLVRGADRLVQRYGSEKLYLLFPVMSEKEAEELMEIAERDWTK